jgi:non-specific serine/threonine protein kinase
VTSREPLGIGGELTYRVPSLSVPESSHDTGREEAMAFEATRLFVERARLQRPDFDVTDKDAATLASICRRLDGIALAIELAAPRLRVMSLEELSRRLKIASWCLSAIRGLATSPQLRSLID